ncbi:hypothetical protein [Magnetococcus sp. PR-3]|uniref:hypothetical protein n=1 Tax=Magnetococcus sp. PR-3 TaxID=3120355 RepID=UPI002FCE562A
MMIQKKVPKEAKALLDVWTQLGSEDRHALEAFAHFLLSQRQEQEPQVEVVLEPLNIAAPKGESAVKALKRLKKNYPMIEADMSLLDAASQLIMERVMGGADTEIIPKMEKLFEDRYQLWKHDQA